MTEITRIDGSPGAGKSHTLKNKLRKEIQDNGIGLGDFQLVTFTNAARDDVVDDVTELFDAGRDDIEGSVRTLHSTALEYVSKAGLIDDYDEQIISQGSEQGKADNVYETFAEQYGMNYYGQSLKDSREKGTESGTGDALFRLDAWLRLTQRDATDAKLAPFDVPWSVSRAADLIEKWRAFKKHHYDMRKYEHADYLNVAIEKDLTPDDVSVLLLDEFQDFSPQEYLYYKHLRDAVDRVYLAGDPNQSIYSFRAGHPYYFRNTDADNDVYLSESYRCRGEIADFARQVLNGSPEDSTDFSPVYDDGEVNRVTGRDDALRTALTDALDQHGHVYMLARTNSKVHSIKRWLKDNGFPYRFLGSRWRSLWNERMTDMLDALRGLQSDSGGVDRDGVNRLIAHTPKTELRKSLLEDYGGVYTIESVWNAFTDVESVSGIVETLDFPSHKREALAAAAHRQEGNDPADVAVGTIHAAKGLERDAVFLFNSYNKHIAKAYKRDSDTRAEEHRVAYVGATRASRQLNIVNGFFNGPKMKPITTALRGSQ